MKIFYAHFGSDGINRVLADGVEPPVKGPRVVWNREMRARFGPVHDCEFVDGQVRKKQNFSLKTAPKKQLNWAAIAAATAAAAGGILAGSLWG